ncbi:hypothetical protein [Bacteroides pyogenes]|uniref:hypothetical protein n=1 Tax=Bacteroides pyogenes TaxID=310300 RepID=UPI002FDADC39
MAKIFECKMNNHMYDVIFSTNRLIKNKTQLVRILLETIRYMMYQHDLDNPKGKIVIFVDRMSRLFFFSKEKYYSISLPMTIKKLNPVEESAPKYEFELNGMKLTSELISSVIRLTDLRFEQISCAIDFADILDEEESRLGKDVWCVFRDLLLSEEGYVRYDKDTGAYMEAKNKQQPDLHPENHLDICIHSKNQFKIGLKEELSENDFIDIFNLKTDCKFLI